MHRKLEVDLLPLDTEIERTLKNLRKITIVESKSMVNQRERLQAIPEAEEEAERTQRPNTIEGLLEAYYSRGVLCSEITCNRNQQF